MENPRKQARLRERKQPACCHVRGSRVVDQRQKAACRQKLRAAVIVVEDFVRLCYKPDCSDNIFLYLDGIRLYSGSAANTSRSRVCYLPTTGCLGLLLVSCAVRVCMLSLLKGIIRHFKYDYWLEDQNHSHAFVRNMKLRLFSLG